MSGIPFGGNNPGLATDGWIKQASQASPDEGISLLIRLHKDGETQCRFPTKGGLGSTTVLLPKGKGPTSIAATGHWILPRLHRLWAAVRKPLVRSWRLSKQ